ncbi:MAG: EAL domain-containing protein [Pseudomonadota bacterium]
MTESAAVPLVVFSATRDPVEAINSLLRNSGIPVHCTWIPGLQDLGDALVQLNPELLFCVIQDDGELQTVVEIRDHVARDVPLLVVRPTIDENVIAADLKLGARDSLTFTSSSRIQSVVERELRSHRLERALHGTLRSAQDYRKQLEVVLTRSNDAIAQVQEGILVEANASWLELVGVDDVNSITGQPIMDFFDENTHAALKGALVACLQGRWNDHSLRVEARLGDDSTIPLELVLSLGEREGEPCVRMIVPAQKRDDRHLANELADAVRRNPRTGLLYRMPMLEALQKRLDVPIQGGSRFLVSIRPDHYPVIEKDLGVIASEDFIQAVATLVKAHLHPTDVLGHFSGAGMLALIERGTERDAETWCQQLLEKISRHVFQIGIKSIKATMTMGLSVVPNATPQLDAVINDALEAVRRGRQRGGNQLCQLDRADHDTRVQAYDDVWVKHIKAALMENRFRLVQQPIASLQGTDTQMFDVLVRMVDTQGKEILPSEFMPAAERNDLLKNIDRWVVNASLGIAAKRKPGCLFVRLSKSSVVDGSLIPWLDNQLKNSQVDPSRICIQITEEIATKYVAETRRLADALRERRLRFAIEHFGVGRDPQGLIASLPMDFIKIDGSLMQGLSENEVLQDKVRLLVDAAIKKSIATIAERVEDANTMAVLWQLKVQYLQGYFVQTPEDVVMGAR